MAELATGTPEKTSIEATAGASLVDWGAVIAGALLAAALSFVLLTFGTAIGLSATSPWPNAGLSAKIIASLAVFWALAQQIGSFLAGGYVAGRLRARRQEISSEESDFRDGLHGALVWALGIVLGAALAVAAAGALARTGVEAAAGAASGVASSANPTELALDGLLRATPGASPTQPEATSDARAEIARILASSVATGGLNNQDRTYLAQRVAQLTGLSPQDAQARIQQAIDATRRAADKARRAAVLGGLVTAVSLLTSLAAAWWAAIKGGQHRDNAVPPSFGFPWTRRRFDPGT